MSRPSRGALPATLEELEPRVLLASDSPLAPMELAWTGDAVVTEATQVAFEPAGNNEAQTHALSHELVFIDQSVAGWETLRDDVLSQASAERRVEVVLLDAGRDGIAQVSEALGRHQALGALHFITHGSDGVIRLGATALNFDTLLARAGAIRNWGSALGTDADILLYGCDVAGSDDGRALVRALAGLTGADVAASEDRTGSESLGGDWELEYACGDRQAAGIVAQAAVLRWEGVLDITTGLIGHWTFDATAADASGNGYDGTLTNGAAVNTTSSTNKIGTGKLTLDGSNDYVNLDAHLGSFSGLTQGSISAWIKTTGTGGLIFGVNDTADGASGTAFWVYTDGKLAFTVYENNVPLLDVKSTASVNDGLWHHVAVTNTTTGNKLYIDGQQASVTYVTGTSATDHFFDDVTGQDVLHIGQDQNNGGPRFLFNGSIDDVRVYNRVLTAADVVDLNAYTGNQIPVNAVSGAQSTNEDTSLVFSSGNGNALSVSESDANGGVVEVTLSVTHGGLTLANTGGLTFTSGDGSGDAIMTFRGTVANVNTALDGLTYAPTGDYYGSDTLTLATRDSLLVSLDIDSNLQAQYRFDSNANDGASGTAQNGTLVNGASVVSDGTRGNVLSLAGTGDYVTIASTFGTPTEVTIGGWVNITSLTPRGEFISIDDRVHIALDETGLGVKGSVQVGAGAWTDLTSGQYITGTGWRHVMYTYSDSSNMHRLYIDGELVAAATITNSIYWTGATTTYLGRHPSVFNEMDAKLDDVRIYDRALSSTEVATLAADLSLADADTVALTVNSVNDQPVFGSLNGTPTYTEGGSGVALDTNVTISDTELSAANNFNGATLSLARQGGANSEDQLAFDGVTVTVSGANVYVSGVQVGTYVFTGGQMDIAFGASATQSRVDALMQNIHYWNSSDTPPASVQIDWSFSDGNSGAQGSGGAKAASGSVTVSITAVNDSPTVGTNTGVTVSEGATGTVITSAMLNEGDPDDSGTGLTYTVTTAPGNGTLKLSGVALGVSGTFTQADIAGGLVTYDHNGSEASSDSFAFSLADGGENGATAATGTFTITVTAVNDSPSVATNTGVTVAEGSTGTAITSAMLNEGDPDDAGTGLTYTVTTAPGNGTLKLSGVALGVSGTFTQADIAGGLVTYDHDGSETSSDSFAFSLADGGENGATAATGTFAITVTAVNDASPVITSGSGATAAVTVAENQTAVTTITATDGDLPAQSLSYSILAGGDAAWFTINASSGVLAFSSAPDFEANADANGDNVYEVTVQVSDGSLTDTQAVSVTLSNVNEAPTLGANALTITQGASVILTSAEVSATDPDTASGSLVFDVSAIANGQFELISSPGVAITSFTQAQVGAGQVLFRHDGSTTAPVYQVSAGDGALSTGAASAAISFSLAASSPTSAPDPILPPSDPGGDGGGAVDSEVTEDGASASDAASGTHGDAATNTGQAEAASLAVMAGLTAEPSSEMMPESSALLEDSTRQAQRHETAQAARVAKMRLELRSASSAGQTDTSVATWTPTVAARNALLSLPSVSAETGFALLDAPHQEGEEEITLGGVLSPSLLGGLVAGFGTAWWAGRAGVLLGSVVAGTPAWARLDPLPIALQEPVAGGDGGGDDPEPEVPWLPEGASPGDSPSLRVY